MIYNIPLVSAIHQNISVVCIYYILPFLDSFPFEVITEYWEEFYVLQQVLWCVHVSSRLPVYPSLPSAPALPAGSQKFVLYICDCFCFVNQFNSVILKIPYIRNIIWYFFLSDTPLSMTVSIGPTIIWQVVLLHSFCGWVIFHCIYVPCLYPFLWRWIFRLLLCHQILFLLQASMTLWTWSSSIFLLFQHSFKS